MYRFFDAGYVTINNKYKVGIIKRLKEYFQNSREYYQYHGKELPILPAREINKPASEYIDRHNVSKFLGKSDYIPSINSLSTLVIA